MYVQSVLLLVASVKYVTRLYVVVYTPIITVDNVRTVYTSCSNLLLATE